MDRPIEWWCGDHWVHGHAVHLDHSSDAGVVCVGESVHDHGSHQWHGVHVHGEGDERVGCRFSLDGFGLGDSFDGSWCTDLGFGDVECEWSVGCFLDCAGQQWWSVDHWLHGYPVYLDDCAVCCLSLIHI